MDKAKFENYLNRLDLSDQDKSTRLLSILSAAIAVCSEDLTETILLFLKKDGFNRDAIYETVLQSYLFLGFPRMIEGAIVFNKVFGDFEEGNKIEKISSDEAELWFSNGIKLCQQVYGTNYEILKNRFENISPEIFRWMVIEGYGKVLSRPKMTHIERELAEVAALIVDGRERQLLSHIMGSLNVGAKMELIKEVNLDIKPLAGNKNFELAEKIINDVLIKYEAKK